MEIVAEKKRVQKKLKLPENIKGQRAKSVEFSLEKKRKKLVLQKKRKVNQDIGRGNESLGQNNKL